MGLRHFLTLSDLNRNELQSLIKRACELKNGFKQGHVQSILNGRIMAMIFEKSSTRTRVSFESAMLQLGGHAIFLSPDDTHLGRGEPIEDTARVLSKMVDCVMMRTFEHEKLIRFADHSDVPVINGLSDTFHPCQLLADMQTYYEMRGCIQGKKVAWLGDGNNMCHSYINAAQLFEFDLSIACPETYQPLSSVIEGAIDSITITDKPEAAIEKADLVVTDVWASMGQERESKERTAVFQAYRVDSQLMALAAEDAVFMHCLPAHRGEEVTTDVIDGPQSAVWEEAGNRLHSQKALLEFLLT